MITLLLLFYCCLVIFRPDVAILPWYLLFAIPVELLKAITSHD